MINRAYRVYNGTELIEEGSTDITWEILRKYRDRALADTDFWALKDLTMSQAKKDYRIFLRDMPDNYDSANDAADAWHAYEVPT